MALMFYFIIILLLIGAMLGLYILGQRTTIRPPARRTRAVSCPKARLAYDFPRSFTWLPSH